MCAEELRDSIVVACIPWHAVCGRNGCHKHKIAFPKLLFAYTHLSWHWPSIQWPKHCTNLNILHASPIDVCHPTHPPLVHRQQRWPTEWVPSNTEVGTYFLPTNSTVDATTPLAPFWRDSDGYYTSNDVRDIEALGYTYQPPPGGDPKRGPRISASTISLLPVQQGEGVKQVAQADAMAGDVQEDLTWAKQGFGDIAGFFTRRRLLRAQLASSSHGISALQQHDGHWEQAMHLYGRGYHGYRWQLRFAGTGEHQLGLPFFMRVFTAKQYKEHALLKRSVASELPGYCGSYYEFSAKHTAAGMRTPVIIDVTECMMRSGMETSFTPKLVGNLASGPSGVPSNAKDFVWTATTHDGTDVSKMFAPPKLIWSVLAEDGELRVGSV